jgi:murein L,D-transpeptidase YcbB/YkuD
MAWLNGRFPKSALAPITRAANGEQAYLVRSAAKAFNAMNAESEARFGVTLRASSARVAYRSYADQVYFWNLYISGRGALAARPGTSNHGWGLAVDFATPQMRHIVDQIGAKYGWAKKWSDAPSEWWHIKYRSGVWNGKSAYLHPVIKRGSYGRKVVTLKKLMWAHGLRGFNRFLPGYGKATEDAIKRLQKAHHLKADGVVGPKTWELLGKN